MKLSERIRRDRQRYAALSPSEKRAFLWDYYKIPILALVCAVLLGGIALLEGLNSRSVAVYAVLVNAAPDTEAAQTCLEDLLTDSGMDLKGKRVDANVSLSLGQTTQEAEDAQTVQVLAALFGVSGLDFFAADEEIFDRFYQELAFGTAGLRGVLGAGTNRMNIYTVRKATQGMADYLNEKYPQSSDITTSAAYMLA